MTEVERELYRAEARNIMAEWECTEQDYRRLMDISLCLLDAIYEEMQSMRHLLDGIVVDTE